MTSSFRRIVTDHDADGRAVIASDLSLTPEPIPGGVAAFQVVWTTPTVPADNADATDGATRQVGLSIPEGSVIRVVDMLPGKTSPMHRTHSLDYGIVISGTVELELDSGDKTLLQPGDIVVQRGTNHLWRNPSVETTSRIAFVLIGAAPVRIGGQDLPEIEP